VFENTLILIVKEMGVDRGVEFGRICMGRDDGIIVIGVKNEPNTSVVFHAVYLEADAVAPSGRNGAEVDVFLSEKLN
jgi:hypothetical protein